MVAVVEAEIVVVVTRILRARVVTGVEGVVMVI